MSTTRTIFTICVPSMIVGAVVFSSAFGRADSGRDVDDWPSSDSTIVAQADPPPAPRPGPAPRPVAPVAPVGPVGPAGPAGPLDGIAVEIHDGKVTISGVPEVVGSALRSAHDAINSSGLPRAAKDKLNQHIDNVRTKIQARLSHLDIANLDQLGDEMNKMGDELGKEMDELGKEMEKYGDVLGKDLGTNLANALSVGKNFSKSLGPKGFHVSINGVRGTLNADDDGDDEKLGSPPDVDDDDALDDAVSDLGDLSLRGPQRDQIQKLRSDSDRAVATAKKQLDRASDALKKQLDNPATNDAEIARSIDVVTQQEAAIRKARILAWHDARRVLDDAQRKKVEDAAAKAKQRSK